LDPARAPAAPTPSSARSDERTFASLLADRSSIVQREVRREIARRGKRGLALLRRVERHGDPRAGAQARALLLRHGRARVVRRMLSLACAGAIDLEKGLLLISRFEEPGLDLRPYMLAMDAMAAEVVRRVEARHGPGGRAAILCDYLGRELGYRGDAQDYHQVDNVVLHRAIVRKRGLPLTLCALYLLVARRAGIRAAPVALPGHVVLRIYDDGQRGVLVDPFHGGAVLSERECLGYLARHGLPFEPRWFDDGADDALWLRQLHNLAQAHRRRGGEPEVRALAPLISALGRRMSGRDRGPRR
jgi:regulator of sirC expression with transglutaminase-like and TPR domain